MASVPLLANHPAGRAELFMPGKAPGALAASGHVMHAAPRSLGNMFDVGPDFLRRVEELSSLVMSDAKAHGVRHRLDLEPDLPMVMGDRAQIQQVIINLVRNALEALSSAHGPCLRHLRRATARHSSTAPDGASRSQQAAKAALALLLTGLGVWTLHRYLPALIWAAILAIAVWPLYQRAVRRWPPGKHNIALPSLFVRRKLRQPLGHVALQRNGMRNAFGD